MSDFRCGYVALIGRPNAGKSTLLNQILGSKLAITSAKPQTTRDRIVGIFNDDQTQAILLDTPGIHRAWTELNKAMVKQAMDSLKDADAAVWIVDMSVYAARIKAEAPILDEEDLELAAALVESKTPVILVTNKIDIVPPHLTLPVIDAWTQALELAAAVPISALKGDGVEALQGEIRRALPVAPALYPQEEWADVTERFLVAEIIREKIFHLTEQEVPYAAFVEVEQFDESERETNNRVRIFARIGLERASQKGIIIGKGGEMLKRIGTLARKEIQGVLECKVHLDLHVSVVPDWSRTARGLKRAGYRYDK
ncbi:MAG: GTPase Era [Deltaproteobacteria bacterium]|nr:GTPase Era [Deltaproteobacteria bacterium]